MANQRKSTGQRAASKRATSTNAKAPRATSARKRAQVAEAKPRAAVTEKPKRKVRRDKASATTHTGWGSKYVQAVRLYTERTRSALTDVWQEAVPKAVSEMRALADKGRHVMDDVKQAVSQLPVWPRLRRQSRRLVRQVDKARKSRVRAGLPAKLVSGA